jgi:hypothetical protein
MKDRRNLVASIRERRAQWTNRLAELHEREGVVIDNSLLSGTYHQVAASELTARQCSVSLVRLTPRLYRGKQIVSGHNLHRQQHP